MQEEKKILRKCQSLHYSSTIHVPSEKEAISLDNQKAQAALSTLSIEVHVYNIPLLISTYDVHVHLLHYHDLSQDKNVIQKL